MAEYTTKLQQFKIDAIDALKNDFQSAKDCIFADYRGLNVEEITSLRNKLRENGALFKVVKNRYVKIAMRDLEMPEVSDQLLGPTAMTLTTLEAGPAAKVLVEFSGSTPLSVKGGIIDGQVFDGEQMIKFSQLPTKDELFSMLMSAMNGPVQNFLYALQGVPQKLVRTLKAVGDKKAAESN